MRTADPTVREAILRAAERKFARSGYAGTSVQDIIEETDVTKPVLYYHFESKAGLFRAVVDYAYDECHRLMQEAAGRSEVVLEQLEEVLTATFEFLGERRDLTRLVFSTGVAAPGELPEGYDTLAKGARNFEFIHGLVKEGLADGTFDPGYNSYELTYGVYGMMNFHLGVALVRPEIRVGRETARKILRLFMEGAAAK
jgi:AcrR family transcriptional regulator